MLQKEKAASNFKIIKKSPTIFHMCECQLVSPRLAFFSNFKNKPNLCCYINRKVCDLKKCIKFINTHTPKLVTGHVSFKNLFVEFHTLSCKQTILSINSRDIFFIFHPTNSELLPHLKYYSKCWGHRGCWEWEVRRDVYPYPYWDDIVIVIIFIFKITHH